MTDSAFLRAATTEECFLALHQFVTDALEAFRRDHKDRFLVSLGSLYRAVNQMSCGAYGFDLNEAIDRKMVINRERHQRNGGKRI